MSAAAVLSPIVETQPETPTALVLARPPHPRLDFSPILGLVMDSVTSPLTKRAYSDALAVFLDWFYTDWQAETEWKGEFNRAAVLRYKAFLEGRGVSSSSVNKSMAAIKKLAKEARYNSLLPNEAEAGIRDVKGSARKGCRLGNWLIEAEAQRCWTHRTSAR